VSARALVLDFGGVITRTVFETQAENERALGLPTEDEQHA
jgi:putative hydrolase of the HAD superfamily